MNDNKISVVINTYNAEKHLKTVLESVKNFDEILICDMESTDNTIDIAQKYGCRIITFPKGNIRIVEPARQFAITNAIHPWVLVVDADEIVTEELQEKLYSIIKSDNDIDGCYISRHNKFIGVYTKSQGHDYILRFFKKDLTEWPPLIHSKPIVNGNVKKLPSNFKLLHLADETTRQWISKMNDYTDYEVDRKQNKKYGVFSLFWRPIWRFFKNYVIMGGFKNGRRGLLQSIQWAIYQQVFVSKILEKRLRDKL